MVLPDIPGENPYSHEGIAWVKDAKARLAAHGLIEMVTGDGVPPRAKSIRIFDLTLLPPLPTEHRHHESRNSERIKIANDNDGKIAEVERIVYEEWLSSNSYGMYVCMKRYGVTRTCAPALAWGEADGVDCQRLCVVTDEW